MNHVLYGSADDPTGKGTFRECIADYKTGRVGTG